VVYYPSSPELEFPAVRLLWTPWCLASFACNATALARLILAANSRMAAASLCYNSCSLPLTLPKFPSGILTNDGISPPWQWTDAAVEDKRYSASCSTSVILLPPSSTRYSATAHRGFLTALITYVATAVLIAMTRSDRPTAAACVASLLLETSFRLVSGCVALNSAAGGDAAEAAPVTARGGHQT